MAGPDDLQFYELAPAWAREMFRALSSQNDSLRDQLTTVLTREDMIMAEVKVAQEDLDTLQTDLDTIADDLETELQALNVPEGDLTGVQAIVDRLRSDVKVPTPAPTPDPGPAAGT
jgi:chromosome segregation ATPase